MKKLKLISIYTLSLFYINIGVSHFISPDFFKVIMPPYIPFSIFFVYLSGFFEILFGLMIIFKKSRYYGATGLCLLLIFVFPANVYLYHSYEAQEILNITKDGSFVRLFFQIPLLILAYWHSKEKTSKKIDLVGIIIFIPTIIYFLSLSL